MVDYYRLFETTRSYWELDLIFVTDKSFQYTLFALQIPSTTMYRSSKLVKSLFLEPWIIWRSDQSQERYKMQKFFKSSVVSMNFNLFTFLHIQNLQWTRKALMINLLTKLLSWRNPNTVCSHYVLIVAPCFNIIKTFLLITLGSSESY